ncbi:flagellar biosynthetic protein FliR [Simiduia aestuariiviva]|uniref:Flagellar biosynthetic protein FliR n=1 Tax=Simiduia aestuariiviva TaxID=1510459 RepID=A0A839UPF8_9GAMM|nr:flagellar biosynthetic protein FliR [Simiduia aestuariiviva]MBB3168410.1 flagellar biosynthetic protein FliR [Simiduia aestuariiviva]
MDFSAAVLTEQLLQYFLPLVRVSAFMLAAPIFGSRLVNARARLLLALLVTALVAPALPELPKVSGFGLDTWLLVVQQSLIGMAAGFAMQLAFQVAVLAGQYIAMKMGLGFASMNDPSSGLTVTVVSQYYLMLVTMLFVVGDGHLLMIQLLAESFYTTPIGVTMPLALLWDLVMAGSWMFGAALLIALPVLTSLMIVNISFGVMGRSAPQMNIFTVGFPITLILGAFLIWFGFTTFLGNYNQFMQDGFNILRHLWNIS